MSERKIKIGVIGCGAISMRRHLPEYASRSDVEIAALYNRTRSKAEEACKIYGGRVCDSIEELVAMDLDAVSVCSANTAHASDSILALRSGKHVLCEKPMDVTMENCENMAAEAEKAGKLLMIAQNQRFSSAHVKARELVAEGAIGKLLSFETKFGHSGPERWTGTEDTWFFRKSAAGMGALADLGIHKTDLIHYLTGEAITSVYAHTATLDKRYPEGGLIDVEDNAWCIYGMDSGMTGTMHVSWTDYGQEYNSVVLHGTKGSIRCYDDREYSLILETDDGKTDFLSTEGMLTNADQTIGTGKDQHSGVIDEFVECIQGRRNCRCSGQEALKAMRVIFAALRSSAEGRIEEIPENRITQM
jgi:predicted dehydrogenase